MQRYEGVRNYFSRVREVFVNSIPEKVLDGFRRNLVGGLGMVQGSCHLVSAYLVGLRVGQATVMGHDM